MSNYLSNSRDGKSWLSTLDHKRIGVMYLVTILISFLLGGIFALLIRAEALSPGEVLMDANTFNRLFTFHGVIMIFLFIVPAIPAALGNFVLPLMLGARDLAYPRMNRLSFWLFAIGSLFTLTFLFINSLATGWTFYTPYSAAANCRVTFMVVGLAIMGLSSLLSGLNFILSIHKFRPAWMSWSKLPLFAWTLYLSSIVNIFISLVLGVILQLLIAERFGGKGMFDPALGGDPALFQRLFWLYAHPAIYITLLPALGIVSEIIPVFSRKSLFGYKALIFSSAALAFFTLFSWGQHIQTTGQSAMTSTIFSLMALIVFIPSALVIFNWLSTLYKGSISLAAPMLYGLMFIFFFTLGSLSGLFLGNLTTNVHLHGSTFEIGHLHFMLVGGTLIAFIGGLHFWWPKMFGRMYSEKWAALSAALIFAGINLSFFPQLVIGVRGMPRRYFNYPVEFTCENRLSSLGAFLLAAGFVLVTIYLVHSLVKGKTAPANPWGGATLDWSGCASPPVEDNFEGTPDEPGDPYDFSKLNYDSESDSWRSV
jgi:cytochrome c oxidase subunit I